MRVAVYPGDLGGCGFYRLIWPSEALRAQGHDVTVHHDGPGAIQGVMVGHGEDARLIDVVAPDADVVVLQRPMFGMYAEMIPMLQAQGIVVVVDVDDDFSSISARNVSHAAAVRADRWWKAACRAADLVTVTTPALAKRYGAHGRVAVLPNYVPERYLSVGRNNIPDPEKPLFVGWSGSVATHPGDLQVTRGAIQRAMDGTDARFAVIGTGKDVQRCLSLREPPLACGWLHIDNYPEALAQLDVGIVPLEPSAFNEAKSWLKGLEMAALGVPFIASPTDPYRGLWAQGAGWLAAKPKDWQAEIKGLLVNPERRAYLAAQGRAAARRLTVEANAWQWAEAWQSAMIRQRVRTA